MSEHVISEPKPALRRSLKLHHIVFLGLAYLAPLAVFDTFGIVSSATSGHVPLAYVFVLIAVLITALSYARMAKAYPSAGSAYSYTRASINPYLSFLVGWTATLDYLLLPMLNALLSAVYMQAVFPQVPAPVWVLSTIVICTAFNLGKVNIAAKLNVAIVVIQVVVVVAFVVLTTRSIMLGNNGSHFSIQPFISANISMGAVMSGAAILAVSFLGFDAVSTLSEEAERPKRDIPRAIVLIVFIAGIFLVGVTYFLQTLFPEVSALGNIVGASPEIARYIGGPVFQALFIGGYMVAVLGCGVTQQMSAARLLFAMGRDGALPRRFFASVNKSNVPAKNTLLIALLACSACFLDLQSAASLVNFGAFVAFLFVNLSVIFTYYRSVRARRGGSIWLWVVLPGFGVLINVALWAVLDSKAKLIGVIWVALGLGYLAWKTRFFRLSPPEFKGEINTESVAS